MTANDNPRFPHLGKLSIAVLENLVKPFLGDKAIEEIKAPVLARDQLASLASALASAEKRFVAEYADAEVRQAVLDLPLADLPSVKQAVGSFYSHPTTDITLYKILFDRLANDFPRFSDDRISAAVSTYLGILKEEFVNISSDIRDKLRTLASLNMQSNVARVADSMEYLKGVFVRKDQASLRPGTAPPLPSLIIGREDALRDLKTRLGIRSSSQASANVQVLTAVHGWPGVGKTTLAAALAYDPDIATIFPDGVLWVSLGPAPSIFSELATWGRALGTDELLHAKTMEEASARLAGLLRNQRRLLIVDDVWEPEHVVPFRVGGRGCTILVTTRLNGVAQALAPTPENIYRLAILSDEKALELLKALAPSIVAQYPEQSLELVHELEGLPLALQVAGRLLNAEASYGFGVIELLTELRDGAKHYEGAKLLRTKAPADRIDLATETTPTVAALLQRSTDRLDPAVRDCFAFLGVFAPKPATFDLEAMKAMWLVEDPKPIARTLVDRGLIEFIPQMERYQVHALLVMHAKTLFTE